jgi:hypothetical protein
MEPINLILESRFKGLLNWSIAKIGEKEYFAQIRGENSYWGAGNGDSAETAIKRAYEAAERFKHDKSKLGIY